ncbi:MAG: lipoprotein, partial [Halothiobacillaceae bacterium]
NDTFGDTANKIVYLDQNWDRWDSLWFYNTTQGSNLLPYDIFVNLEQKESEVRFKDPLNMNQFRYLPQRDSWNNPDALPVGFVKDSYQGSDYIGLTCAACHTTQINYKQTGIRIDGGPALADMEGMLTALQEALEATLNDKEKLARLATRMGNDATQTKERLQQTLTNLSEYNRINTPTHGDKIIRYGYGRLDAFGRIYNRVLAHMTPDDRENFNPANASVSYPFLWDTPHHDFVQWNGVADNNDGGPTGFLGPLGRNTGEALGVFATFSLEKQKTHLGYRASVEKRNLIRLEKHLTKLESPLWPQEVLPPIDAKLADEGEQVFKSYKCALCHSDDETFVRDDPNRLVIAQFASVDIIGTDPQMASNALNYQGKSGLFKGEPMDFGSSNEFSDTTHVVFALQKAVKGVILARDPDKSWLQARAEWLYDLVTTLFDNPVKKSERHLDFEINTNFPNNLNAYKARPLNGIWATAPYLHNGSVPNLYELFLPSCTAAELAA